MVFFHRITFKLNLIWSYLLMYFPARSLKAVESNSKLQTKMNRIINTEATVLNTLKVLLILLILLDLCIVYCFDRFYKMMRLYNSYSFIWSARLVLPAASTPCARQNNSKAFYWLAQSILEVSNYFMLVECFFQERHDVPLHFKWDRPNTRETR